MTSKTLRQHFAKQAAEQPGGFSTGGLLSTAGLLALGLAGRKGMRDMRGIGDKARSWMLSSQGAAKRVEGSGLADAVRTARAYSTHGSQLTRSKVLGMPIPYWAIQGSTAVDSLAQGSSLRDYLMRGPLRGLSQARWEAATSGGNGWKNRLATPKNDASWGKAWSDAHAPIPNASRHGHYWKYKNYSPEDLDNYAIYGEVWDKLSDSTRAMLKGPKAGQLSTALLHLRRTNPDEAKLLLDGVKDRISMFGGKGELGGGLAHKYYHDVSHPAKKVENAFSALGTAGMAGTGAMLAHQGLGELRGPTKSAAAEDQMLPLALTAGGVGLGASGVGTLRSPLDVGVTWSEVPDHGDGHKNPGRALAEALEKIKKEDPRFANINIDRVIRNQHGAVDPKFFGKVHDAFFDTGMGATSQYGFHEYNPTADIAARNPAFRMNDPVRPRVRLGGFTGYTTDIGALGNPHDSFKVNVDSPLRALGRKLGIKDNYLAWGPEDITATQSPEDLAQAKKLYNTHQLSHSGMPSMTQAANEAVSWAHEVGRKGVIDAALASDALTPEQKKMLANIGDRKLLFVTGSGRGDYVATRMLDIQRSLRRQGLEGKYLLAGALGSTATSNPDAIRLMKDPSVLTFGRLPQNLYIGLPAVADLHSASTGTSAAMEALSGPSNLTFVPEWSKLRARELRRYFGRDARQGAQNYDPGVGVGQGIARDSKMRSVLQKVLPHVNLDVWNPGNREYGYRQPGVHSAQTGDEFVRIAEGLTDADYAAARTRGLRQMGHNAYSRGRMTEAMTSILGRQQQWKNIRGGGKVMAGAGLAGLGLALAGGKEPSSTPQAAAAPAAAATVHTPLEKLTEALPSWARGESGRNLAIGGGAAAAGSLLAYLMARRHKKRRAAEQD